MALPKATTAMEQQLIDMLSRIEIMKEGAVGVHIKMSSLTSENRTHTKSRIASSLLDEVVSKSQARLFTLEDSDLILLGRNVSHQLLMNSVEDISRLFQNDSFFSTAEAERFATIYDLETTFPAFSKIIKNKLAYDQATGGKESQKVLTPIAPEHLDIILRNIKGFNILKVVRRQEAIQIARSGKYLSLFFEYFTSMADLKSAIAPDVNMLSNRWLFQHLSETLDKRMLSIASELQIHTPNCISLNLNISTIFTSEFSVFLEHLPDYISVIAEVQLMDVIQNTKNYILAKDLLRASGHRILIDGLHPISFQFLDLNLLDPDLIKLIWSNAILEYSGNESLPDLIQGIDPERIVLVRCEDETAIKWALENGISRFQGYFIDALSGAGTRCKCSKSNSCTMQQCITRKACIAGPVRLACVAQNMLDTSIEKNL